MRDQTLGMMLATAIAAPVVVVCCGSGITLIGSALTGMAGWLSGAGLLVSVLLAIVVGGFILLLRGRSGSGSSTERTADAGEHPS